MLWAGSDDGLIHISRDGGKNWTRYHAQPAAGAGAGQRHRALAVRSRHRLRRRAPATSSTTTSRYLYRHARLRRRPGTGSTRASPDDDFTRVIRADPVQKGLLYAGTETGIYISFDDGESWQRLQLNLPVSPIHEILVKGTDLIAGTHGRSIWILDDLTPLRAIAAGEGQPTQLFAPRTTTRVLPGVDWTDNTPGLDQLPWFGRIRLPDRGDA